jgi:NAD(P)-dependent dehydrogenase (short-subunit alcohol dehydrogenase family)
VYATAKAAVIGFTRSVARDVAGSHITVNVVCPGDVETERSFEHEAAVARTLSREQIAARRHERLARVPLGRLGRPADVAAAVLFFCSADAGYVTGQTLLVNGGSTMA